MVASPPEKSAATVQAGHCKSHGQGVEALHFAGLILRDGWAAGPGCVTFLRAETHSPALPQTPRFQAHKRNRLSTVTSTGAVGREKNFPAHK